MNISHYAASRSDDVIARTMSYSVILRDNTRTAHQACEHAMDLDGALMGYSAYRNLLRRMRAAYILLAADTRLRDGEMLLGRPGSIAADLSRLAHDLGGEPTDEGIAKTQVLATEAEAIGSQYVLAGSRLGGRIIAKRVLEQLPEARVTFFKADDAEPAQAWRGFQRRLDELGQSGQYDYALVRRGAEQTFDLIARALSGRLRCH